MQNREVVCLILRNGQLCGEYDALNDRIGRIGHCCGIREMFAWVYMAESSESGRLATLGGSEFAYVRSE